MTSSNIFLGISLCNANFQTQTFDFGLKPELFSRAIIPLIGREQKGILSIDRACFVVNIQEDKLTKREVAFKVWVFLWVSLLLLSNRFHCMFAEAEEMSRPMGEMVSVKERIEKLIEELKAISKQAFGMALSVHKDPALHTQLAGEAHVLEDRLLDIAKELEKIDPASHKQWVFPISESILDLNFVLADSGTTSLRLGDIIHWGTRLGR